MIVEGGSEIKLKLGGAELKQKLASPMVWKVYRFELPANGPAFTRPLAMMPTDDLTAAVAIDFIELVPRRRKPRQPGGTHRGCDAATSSGTRCSRAPRHRSPMK